MPELEAEVQPTPPPAPPPGWSSRLKNLGPYLLSAAIVAFASFGLAYAFPSVLDPLIADSVKEYLRARLDMTKDDFILLFGFIIVKNCSAMYLFALLGIFFGLPSLFALVFNGTVIGAIMHEVVELKGTLKPLWLLLPHGIFEIPAFLVAMALGIRLGFSWFLPGGARRMLQELKNLHLVFLQVVLPLLLIAALIEAGFIYAMK